MDGLGAPSAIPDPEGRPGHHARAAAPDVLHEEALDRLDGGRGDLGARWDRFHAFWEARAAAGLDPHQRVTLDRGGAVAEVLDRGGSRRTGINFASQDYLSLAAHPALCAAAVEAIGRFGLHGAGPATTQGGSLPLLRLEERLADLLGCRAAIAFPSGWTAGYGTVRALLLDHDHVLIDSRAHACLREGAEAATRNVHRLSGRAPDVVAQRLAQRGSLSRVTAFRRPSKDGLSRPWKAAAGQSRKPAQEFTFSVPSRPQGLRRVREGSPCARGPGDPYDPTRRRSCVFPLAFPGVDRGLAEKRTMLAPTQSNTHAVRPIDCRAGFTIRGAVAWSGLSRSALYREAGAGRLLFRKAGRTTIVDGASLAALVANLPVASIGAERSKGA